MKRRDLFAVQIYLLRHGIAEDGRPGQRDADRPLTSEGAKKVRAILKLAHAAGASPSLILSSPYRRAVETAEICAKEFSNKNQILRTKALTPDSSPQAVWEEIRVHRSETQILLSGHEPLCSALTRHLLGAPSLMVDFKKGALVRIDMDAIGAHPRGVLKWMITARLAGE